MSHRPSLETPKKAHKNKHLGELVSTLGPFDPHYLRGYALLPSWFPGRPPLWQIPSVHEAGSELRALNLLTKLVVAYQTDDSDNKSEPQCRTAEEGQHT